MRRITVKHFVYLKELEVWSRQEGLIAQVWVCGMPPVQVFTGRKVVTTTSGTCPKLSANNEVGDPL